MVRGKVKLQRIDDDGARLASFSKRRSGLLKKAGELAVLCDAEVAVLVFSPKGKLSSFSSISSVDVTFERYLKFSDEERKVKDNVLALEGKCAAFEGQEANRAMRVQKRFLDRRSGGQDITQLKNLEEELERELKEIRFTRVISFFSILFVDNGAEYPKRALLKDAGAHLSRPVMGGQREGGDEDDEPGRDCAMPPGPSRTLQLFADV